MTYKMLQFLNDVRNKLHARKLIWCMGDEVYRIIREGDEVLYQHYDAEMVEFRTLATLVVVETKRE